MGIRFRKSVKIAPGVKVNLNKKSTSVTFGGKGAHYTINSKGERTKSVGIPGSGLYYTEKSGGKSKRKSSNSLIDDNYDIPEKSSNKNGCLAGCIFSLFIFAILFLIIIMVIPGKPKLESISISADTSQVYETNVKIPISVETDPSDYEIPEDSYKSTGGVIEFSNGDVFFNSAYYGDFKVWIDEDEISSNVLTFTIVDPYSEEYEEETYQIDYQVEQEQTVWVSQSGSKYHSNPSCSGMTSATEIAISEAEADGYEPCQKCF